MRDRYVLTLRSSVASNTGGPFVTTWDRVPVTSAGYIRAVYAVAQSITSNAFQNQVEVFRQSDAPSFGSNTGATVLVNPITLVNNQDAVGGSIRAGNDRVAAGDQLQLRTYSGTSGAASSFRELAVSVEVERDTDG